MAGSDTGQKRVDAALTALGDANRREIVAILRRGPRSVVEIAAALPVSRPAVSKHLKVLKDAGLVTSQEDGTRRIYGLDPDGFAAVRDQLELIWDDALRRFALFAENTTPPPASSPAHRRRKRHDD